MFKIGEPIYFSLNLIHNYEYHFVCVVLIPLSHLENDYIMMKIRILCIVFENIFIFDMICIVIVAYKSTILYSE